MAVEMLPAISTHCLQHPPPQQTLDEELSSLKERYHSLMSRVVPRLRPHTQQTDPSPANAELLALRRDLEQMKRQPKAQTARQLAILGTFKTAPADEERAYLEQELQERRANKERKVLQKARDKEHAFRNRLADTLRPAYDRVAMEACKDVERRRKMQSTALEAYLKNLDQSRQQAAEQVQAERAAVRGATVIEEAMLRAELEEQLERRVKREQAERHKRLRTIAAHKDEQEAELSFLKNKLKTHLQKANRPQSFEARLMETVPQTLPTHKYKSSSPQSTLAETSPTHKYKSSLPQSTPVESRPSTPAMTKMPFVGLQLVFDVASHSELQGLTVLKSSAQQPLDVLSIVLEMADASLDMLATLKDWV
eukprot:NODE_2232_length_1242_cov_63.896861_g2121_i0.p1 GENE.NODE_2232_length_1242_cov_63.896861_g2121_i0~~NODE_2232_length_1242_cov_63.896861_g2121_i0.p1  ORF type:complete len:367 (+),score=109.97 NODE_2232_length_1242_cov_63.896861_g2121_i0:13-1113(+)